ncbi:TonB-dependent receptor plug domain-containing protein [Taibaiella chishuiensis]|uniref:Hemoglobin/transferrin/lactoferrin receptor protein n=1 Tax=Taibaiella chishuiensis TaxID=1434707 RepID=A0A2P8DC09_9BACT|nr:TonB-dependent receptor [Taibaiella chishuiensis]PSK94752.1 hemoglobin/transferrin/lactoferrin receptor protein [Taibaiella chishuiensis]
MNKQLSFVILALAGTITSYAQQDSAASRQQVAEIIVTANKFEEKSSYVAQKVEVMDTPVIADALSNTTAGLLEQSGKVFVQRSQLGGGSPVLRGFEASRILLVVDGVRMNNAIYRTGHLQNAITIDDDILERVEILYGPASTIYGSDALGGVVHFQTRQAQLSASEKPLVTTNASVRYSSAYREYSGHADINLGWKKWAILTSLSYSSFGDLRQGNNRNPFYPELGKRTTYIDRVNGVDSIVANTDPNVQKFSGYKQLDLLQKILWQPSRTRSHQLNVQYSTSSDIPRYDRLTDTRDSKLRWAEWYYGPQQRFLASYQYKAKALNGFFDQFNAGASYQKINESRIQRAYRKDHKEYRVEDVDVLALNADLRKSTGRHELGIGVDGQFNFLNSTAFLQNIVSQEKSYGLDTRYPDGSNRMSYTGLYVQQLFKLIPGKLILNDGLRLNYVSLRSRFSDTAILHLPFTEARQRNLTFSANAGVIYLPDAKSKLSFNFATGFRAPNIDDMAKVFESAGGVQLVVPNPNLRPEQSYNFDLSLSRNLLGWIYIEGSGFYSLFRNAMVLDQYRLNGADSVLYNGKLTAVVANQNKARAFIYGFQGSIELRPKDGLSIYGHITYTYGRYQGADGHEVPMDHIPPIFGKVGLSYRYRSVVTEAFILYNGWKHLADYNPYGEDNLQYATSPGMPSWYTLNISSTWTVTQHIKTQIGIENIFDQNYRVFASGINGPGRNLVVKLKAGF